MRNSMYILYIYVSGAAGAGTGDNRRYGLGYEWERSDMRTYIKGATAHFCTSNHR